MLNKALHKLYRVFLNIVAVIYLVFDEAFIYINEKLTKAFDLVPKIEDIRAYWADRLSNMNKYVVLGFLLGHLLASELLGFLSFMLLTKGYIFGFVFMYIFKFLPFFIMSFIFKYTKDELLTISWFKFCYTKFCLFTDYLKRTEIVIKSKEILVSLREKLRIF